MATISIIKLSASADDRDKWEAWVRKAERSQPDLIVTEAQRLAIQRGSVIVVGQRQERGSHSWVWCSTGYVVLAGKLVNRISLQGPEISRGWIET